ncbi:MAG TPA: Gfo/Idh/MocA family oxidoreductase [Candidatus Hydrogenedentes bacterium]|nr:Gfo/Idh/MocA family oxidoreductase [Candidatus Hydrogenedentota bacterium]HIJ75027.1 Gfo/Idh/MocA family oxidoreductase [Candidatus Hydrogenedentota bacterium]
MSSALRYVQIGVGGFGQHWCTQVLPRLGRLGLAEPVAAVDINPAVLPKASEQLGLSANQLFTDARAAIEQTRPDFATVVVPPAHHEQIIDLAVEYGCHILSEKPIADSIAACCRIYRKVKQAGLKMAVTMSHRFDQDKQTLERRVKSGRYGRLDYVVGRNTWTCRRRGQWGEFRYDIPDALLIEGTVHHFDIMRALAGANARRVHCRTWNPEWSEFKGDCQGLMLVEMANGVNVFYEGAKANATTLNNWGQDYWRAECELATLELDNRRLRILSDLEGERQCQEVPLDEQDAWINPWLAELFVNWLNGASPPPNTLDDNIHCAALLFAAIESAHTGRVIDVPAFLDEHMDRVK